VLDCWLMLCVGARIAIRARTFDTDRTRCNERRQRGLACCTRCASSFDVVARARACVCWLISYCVFRYLANRPSRSSSTCYWSQDASCTSTRACKRVRRSPTSLAMWPPPSAVSTMTSATTTTITVASTASCRHALAAMRWLSLPRRSRYCSTWLARCMRAVLLCVCVCVCVSC
jgi:hypothetical protein